LIPFALCFFNSLWLFGPSLHLLDVWAISRTRAQLTANKSLNLFIDESEFAG
jgi:hypothetical protein